MLLNELNITADIEGADEDFIASGGDFSLPTGAYPMTVSLAYLGESTGGAMNVTCWFKEVGGKRQHRETFYVTSGKAKGRKNTYVDKNSGKKRLLPGMEAMNQLATITTGNPLAMQTPETKIVKLYDFDAREELPKEVPVLTDLINKEVLVLITKHRENKRGLVDGAWIDTEADKVLNKAQKFLYPSGHSVAEKRGGTEANHLAAWTKKFNAEYVDDRYKTVAPGAGIEAASTEAAKVTSAEVSDLFKS